MVDKDTQSKARVVPGSDACLGRPKSTKSTLGLPVGAGCHRLKKIAPEKVPLRFATLNVGTLTGRSNELVQMLQERRVDIACLQETKWKGAKAKPLPAGYKLWYNGTTANRNGVAVVASHELSESVTEVIRVSDRLMAMRFDFKSHAMFVVSCYSPQTGCSDTEKDEFWASLDDLLKQCRDDEFPIVGGDLNGHVGKERPVGFEDCHGGEGYGVANEDGERILVCCNDNGLSLVNTFFKKRDSHKITYNSGGRSSQIDFFAIPRKNLRGVHNCKVIPSDNVTPQHRPLIMDIRLQGRKVHRKKNDIPRIKWWRCKKDVNTLASKLCEGLGPMIRNNKTPETVEEHWNEMSRVVKSVAQKVLGRTKPGKQRMEGKETWWWGTQVQEAVKKKKDALKLWKERGGESERVAYLELKREAKKAVSEAKKSAYNRFYADLDTKEGEKNIYRITKSRMKSSQDMAHMRLIKDCNGKILRGDADILDRWREHYKVICNEEFPHPPIPQHSPIPGPVPLISEDEVRSAIKAMKPYKASGPDDIPAEAWKLTEEIGVAHLTALFNKIVREMRIPSEWEVSTTVPIYKGKGDTLNCASYRPIRLISHTMKIFERVVERRLRNVIEIAPGQCGFMKGVGTTDAIFALRMLLERHREVNQTVHTAFLDLEKAFDRVPHELIWTALRSQNVPEEYVNWVKCMYRGVKSTVRTAAGVSRAFPITVGVHQGSALSPLLFITCFDYITRELHTEHPWTLLYADDVALVAKRRPELETQVQLWKDRLDEFGMRLNVLKTEYLESGAQAQGSIKVDGQDLPKTTSFKYLGSHISSSGEIQQAASARINAAWMKWRECSGVLCDKRIPNKLKSKVYRTMVRPVALYGAECWPTTRKVEQMIHCMEMKMLRWSLGHTRMDKIRNEAIREKMQVAPITEKLQESRLRWFGHVQRRDPDTVSKRAFDLKVDGKRPRGKPKRRWMDVVQKDIKDNGLSLEDAQDRAKWRRSTMKADPATKRDKR